MRFRRGMTVLERQQYREEMLQRAVDRAVRQAQRVHRSLTCNDAMQAWGETAAKLHGSCRGEEPGGIGCLCECHDDHRSGVESGTAIEIGNDGNPAS